MNSGSRKDSAAHSSGDLTGVAEGHDLVSQRDCTSLEVCRSWTASLMAAGNNPWATECTCLQHWGFPPDRSLFPVRTFQHLLSGR